MKEKFKKELDRLKWCTAFDLQTISNVFQVTKVLITRYKPKYLSEINALNPCPNSEDLIAVNHTKNRLNSILEGIIAECEIEEEESRAEFFKATFYPEYKTKSENPFWGIAHPQVKSLTKKKYEDGHYADAVETALKEINDIIKKYVKKIIKEEWDGAELMQKAFSVKKPIISLDDLSTETGRNIQQGYMLIFSGAMTGIRNPKTHGNVTITPERAIQLLGLCSLLFYKLEDGGVIQHAGKKT